MTSLRAITSHHWPKVPGVGIDPVVLMFHGYGSNEADLAGLAPMLPAGMPWASLRAPIAMDFGGNAWFPLLDLFSDPEPAPVAEAMEAVWAWVDANVPEGTPIVALGFSQGGFMALQMLRTRPERIAATVMLAGFTGQDEQPGDAVLAATKPPVFWGRGSADQVIDPRMIAKTQQWLAAHVNADEHVYPGLAHSIHEREMADVRDYVSRTLASRVP